MMMMQRLVIMVRRVRRVRRVRLVEERLDVMERSEVWCASSRSAVDVKVCISLHTTSSRVRCTSTPVATSARADPSAADDVVVVRRAHVFEAHDLLELDLREQKFCSSGDVVVVLICVHHHHQVVRVLVVTRCTLDAR